MNVISKECNLREFCLKVRHRGYMGILDAASAEISYQKKLYRERTGEWEFPKGSLQKQYCDDLQVLVHALVNGNFPENRRAGLVRELAPLFREILKQMRFSGNIQQVLKEESVGLTPELKEMMLHDTIGPLVVVVSREEVESCNTELAFGILKRVISSPEMALKYKENVEITFDGYDNDRRELFEIPEVRNYVYKLDEEFPYWLFFLSKNHVGLQALLLCFLPPHLTEEGKKKIFPGKIEALLTNRWLPAMNDIGNFVGMHDLENQEMTERTMQYIVRGPIKER